MGFSIEKTDFKDIVIGSLGSLIAGIIGSIVIVVITFFLSKIITIPGASDTVEVGLNNGNPIAPLMLSLVTFVGTTIAIFLTYFLLNVTNPEKYKRNLTILGQISFFAVFTYIFITPIYIFVGMQNYDNIMTIFLAHILILVFGVNILLETLNNYRHILIGFYGSFSGLFVSSIITLSIFFSLGSGYAKLISLVFFLPLINFLTTFFKYIFEYLYYLYNRFTNLDPLGDIFYQIEMREKEELVEEEERNSI